MLAIACLVETEEEKRYGISLRLIKNVIRKLHTTQSLIVDMTERQKTVVRRREQ